MANTAETQYPKEDKLITDKKILFPEFDMVCNLGQPLDHGFCNLATEFDFKPINEELLY